VGTRLVEQLAQAAAAEGIEAFVAEVMAGNEAMLRVFADTGFDVEQGHVHLQIASSNRFQDAVDRRDHAAVDRSLQSFFRPRAVAVIGASGSDRRRGVPQHRRGRITG
jgi:nicotinamide mononucleotide adenylyltransferase